MIYEMRLEPIPFEATKANKKLIEVRLCDDKRKLIKAGDKIIFKNSTTGERLEVTIIAVRKYSSIEQLAKIESFKKTGGIYTDISQWIQSIYSYYSKTDQEEYGLLAIEINV